MSAPTPKVTTPSDTTKNCTKCGVTKVLSEFSPDRRRGPAGTQAWCKECYRVRRKEEYHRRSYEDPVGYWCQKAVWRKRSECEKRGITWALTADYLRSIAPVICPVFEVPLEYGMTETGNPLDNTASIDRLVPEQGYIPGNVIIVSQLANTIRSTASPHQILAVGSFYYRLFHVPAHQETADDPPLVHPKPGPPKV